MNIKKIMLLSLFMVNAGYIHGMEENNDRPPQETMITCAYYLQKKGFKTQKAQAAFSCGTAATLLGALTARSFYMLEGTDRICCSSVLTSASLYLLYNAFKSYRSYCQYKKSSLEYEQELKSNNSENQNEKKLIKATLDGTLELGSIGNGNCFYFQNQKGEIYPSHRWILNDSSKYEAIPWIDNTPFAKFLP